MEDEFENALAWFRSAPSGWIESATKDLAACADWIWEVLQGDFNDNASTAQMVTGTVISMIPLVDQICDVRDVVANCKKINKEPEQTWHWVSLVLTLIGLFPSVGSLLKGCGKVLFASLRKAGKKGASASQVSKNIDLAISTLNTFLARPAIVSTLKALHIDNPYKYLASGINALAKKLNPGELLRAFDAAKEAAVDLISLVRRFGGERAANDAVELLKVIDNVRSRAERMLAKAVKPVREILFPLARRLDVEANLRHRANLNTLNPHALFLKPKAAPQEATELGKRKEGWADNSGKLEYTSVEVAPNANPGWTSTAQDATRGAHVLDNAHRTFHTIQALTIPPGTVLFRIVDPTSADNSICWMTKAEFDQLKSKADWRRRFAVWVHWNMNGEYVTYTVPPGNGLKVWEGITASQKMEGTDFVLEGGARQIVVDPAHLEKSYLGARQKTGWGYDDLGYTNDLIGIPVQTNNWREG